jgi:hypothetical protein
MSENPDVAQSDPALRRLDRLVGRWIMEGNLVGSDERSVRGEMAFRSLPGGFFLEERVQIDSTLASLDLGSSATDHGPMRRKRAERPRTERESVRSTSSVSQTGNTSGL